MIGLWRRWQRWRRVAGAGGAELFVYGECLCGWYMLAHEGARWPKCPCCGRQVMPPQPPPKGEPNPRLEAAVILVETTEALAERDRIGGVDPPWCGGKHRFSKFDLARWLKQRGYGADGRDTPPDLSREPRAQ